MFAKRCQSCGMPLAKDKHGGGSERDGTKSAEYCSYCYQQGQFTEPNITVTQMRDKVQTIMSKKGLPKLLAKLLARQTSKLKRWKNSVH